MRSGIRVLRGAPLALGGPLLFLLGMALACPLAAEGPDVAAPSALQSARDALAKGDKDATLLASRALKLNPSGTAENLQVALALFHDGHFSDSARYLRRAAASDLQSIRGINDLPKRMPEAAIMPRLNELADAVGDDADLCFLAGAILLMHGDRARAVLVLVRAEELAGTDGQASQLVDPASTGRMQQRALASLRAGDFADAARSFATAALDQPTIAENYAGLALAAAATGDDAVALRMAGVLYARYRYNRLFPWLETLQCEPARMVEAARRLCKPGAPKEHWKLGQLLYAVGGWYRSARECGVQVMLADKLDSFTHDVNAWLDARRLRDDPAGAPEPEPEPEVAPPSTTLEQARVLVRRGEYAQAVNALDALVNETAEAEVFFLLFIAATGADQFDNAAAALKAWFLRVDDSTRTHPNAVREQFARNEQFEAWRKKVIDAREADPNAANIRLLHGFIELSRGRYANARADLAVAKLADAKDAMVLAMDKLLSREDMQSDRNAQGVADEPTPLAHQAKGDELFRKGEYEAARESYRRAEEGDPKLKHLTAALLRVHFALGATDASHYDTAYRYLLVLLTEQDIDNAEARQFELFIGSTYGDAAALEAHVAALRKYCKEGGSTGGELQRAGPHALLGAIELGRGNFNEAHDALKKWHEKDPTLPAPRKALVKLHEYARKRANG